MRSEYDKALDAYMAAYQQLQIAEGDESIKQALIEYRKRLEEVKKARYAHLDKPP